MIDHFSWYNYDNESPRAGINSRGLRQSRISTMSTSDHTTIPLTKHCSKCGNEYPATNVYFGKKEKSTDGLKSWCRSCCAKESRIYYANHKEQQASANRKRYVETRAIRAEKGRAYYIANAERIRQKSRDYYRTHQDSVRAKNREYRDANKEKYLARSRNYIAENPEVHSAAARKYRDAHPDKYRAYAHKRRAIKRGADGYDIPFDEQAQIKRQKGKCYYCLCKLTEYTVEHIIPLSRGGSDHPDNKVLACPSCNYSKRNKLPHEWSKGGRLL